MKRFNLQPSMLSFTGGVFYPTGHTLIMYASESEARQVAHKLFESGFTGDNVYLVTPSDIHSEIAPTLRSANLPLPSVGTEVKTAQEIVQLAQDGHYGLLIATPDGYSGKKLETLIHATPYTLARRYFLLAIEDL